MTLPIPIESLSQWTTREFDEWIALGPGNDTQLASVEDISVELMSGERQVVLPCRLVTSLQSADGSTEVNVFTAHMPTSRANKKMIETLALCDRPVDSFEKWIEGRAMGDHKPFENRLYRDSWRTNGQRWSIEMISPRTIDGVESWGIAMFVGEDAESQ